MDFPELLESLGEGSPVGLLPRILNLAPDTPWSAEMGFAIAAVPMAAIERERAERFAAKEAARVERKRRWDSNMAAIRANEFGRTAATVARSARPTDAMRRDIAEYFAIRAFEGRQAGEWTHRNYPTAIAHGARVGEEFGRDPYAAALARGVRVEDRPNPESTIEGWFSRSANRIVVTNDGGSPALRAVIVAHELGHCLLGHEAAQNDVLEESQELAADAFALGFLVGQPS